MWLCIRFDLTAQLSYLSFLYLIVFLYNHFSERDDLSNTLDYCMGLCSSWEIWQGTSDRRNTSGAESFLTTLI